MPVTREYTEFLKEEELTRRQSIYEKSCNLAVKIFPIPPWSSLAKNYQEAIEFSHMNITAKAAFSFAILATLLMLVIPSILVFFLGFFVSSVLLVILVFAGLTFYYLFDYPTHYSTVFGIRSSAEMIMTIIYMTISMRISPNIENAVRFAAKNLTGALAFDLRKLLWDVYTRKFDSMDAALDTFIDKWKKNNEEFTEAIYLIKSSSFESAVKVEQTLDEAVDIALNGIKEKMKHYAQDLRTPTAVLNAMGILLPIIGLIFLPIMSLFLPDAVQPVFIAIGYDILLPIGVYLLMKTFLERRPYTFHQTDISKHPKFKREKLFDKIFIISLIIAISSTSIGSYLIFITQEQFSINLILYSLIITWGIGLSIVIYSVFSVKSKLKIREEVSNVENEFAEAMFQLGNQLTRGMPLETALKDISPKIKNLRISKFFEIILYNIETFGMTFEQAVFDDNNGAIKQYPSRMIEAIMLSIVEISKKGMQFVSKSMISVSTYLKDAHSVEEELKDVLGETTSTMQLQAVLLAPLTAGIVVAITAMIAEILIALKGAIEKIYQGFGNYGPLGTAGSGLLTSIINVDKIMPVHIFQIIVSIYMMEVVGMLAIFLSQINNGDENLLKRYSLGKIMMLSLIIYTIIFLLIFSLFRALIPVTGLISP